MFRRNVVVEVEGSSIAVNTFKNTILKAKIKIVEFNLDSTHKQRLILKGRKLYSIVIEGKEFNMSVFNFPKCKKKNLDTLIYNELTYHHHNNNENLIYSYEILSTNKNTITAAVFYLDFPSKKLEELLDKNKNMLIGGIFLIQFCVLNYMKRKIKALNYAAIFIYRDILYCLCCKDNIIVDNCILKDISHIDTCCEFINDFIKKTIIYNNYTIEAIYGLSLNPVDTSSWSLFNNEYIDLGSINEQKLLKYIPRSGR